MISRMEELMVKMGLDPDEWKPISFGATTSTATTDLLHMTVKFARREEASEISEEEVEQFKTFLDDVNPEDFGKEN